MMRSPSGKNFFDHSGHSTHLDRGPHAHSAAGFDETFPDIFANGFEEEEFYLAAVGKDSRRDDAGVIEDDQVTVAEKFRKIAEPPVLDALRIPMEHHHARILAPGRRIARDQVVGQCVVEVAGQHGEVLKVLGS